MAQGRPVRRHRPTSPAWARPTRSSVCVPTPLGTHLEPDLTYVEQTADDIAKTLRPGPARRPRIAPPIPRTTREVMLPRFEADGPQVRRRTSSSPTPPSAKTPAARTSHTQTIPKLVGGIDPRQRRAGRRALPQGDQAGRSPSARAEVAEAAKLLENIYRAVNIALVNEMKVVLDAMGIDVWEVIARRQHQAVRLPGVLPRPRAWAGTASRSIRST